MEIDLFEKLLSEKEKGKEEYINRESYIAKEKLKANKNADVSDLIEMISQMVTVGMKDLNVEFVPDDGARLVIDPNKKTVTKNYIYFFVFSRVPVEIKPRYREEIKADTDDGNKKRIGAVYGQKFEAILQFNIIGCSYKEANIVMTRFEELMFQYTGFFKKNGVIDCVFHKQLTDQNFDTYRNNVSVRNLQYKCQIEKLIPEFEAMITDIDKNNVEDNT